MPEPAAVPESTDGIAPTRIDWKFIEGMAEGELCDHEDERSVCNVCKMTLMARALLEARIPAASPVAGVSAPDIQIIRDAIEMGKDDGDIASINVERLQELLDAYLRAQPSAEGDDASGIVPYLVGQIAALGPNPAGSRTNELFALLHEAIDSLRAEGDGWIAQVEKLLAIPCCHTSGVHDPTHAGKYVCDSQKAAAYDRIVAALKLSPDGLTDLSTYHSEPDCYWCKERLPAASPVAKEGRES